MKQVLDESNIMGERFVAFLDILGFSEIIKGIESNNSSDNLDLKRIKSILNFMDEETTEPNYCADLPIYIETKDGLIEKELGDPKLTYVSDCIIVSAEPTLDGFKGLSRKLHKITADLAYDGVFCRGTITKGKLFHHDKVLFGSSYNKAYELEDEKANFPRIIIDPEIIDFFELEEGQVPLAPAFFGKDKDGMFYQRYWTWQLFPPYAESFDNYLMIVRNWIVKNIETFEGDSRVQPKYLWLKDEFNSLVDWWREMEMIKIDRIT